MLASKYILYIGEIKHITTNALPLPHYMKSYRITATVDGEELTQNWSGYDEQVAIAQMMLYEAQQGARSIAVIEVQ